MEEAKGAYVVYITVNSEEQGEAIARGLIQNRMAACANLIPGVTSFFLWEGQF